MIRRTLGLLLAAALLPALASAQVLVKTGSTDIVEPNGLYTVTKTVNVYTSPGGGFDYYYTLSNSAGSAFGINGYNVPLGSADVDCPVAVADATINFGTGIPAGPATDPSAVTVDPGQTRWSFPPNLLSAGEVSAQMVLHSDCPPGPLTDQVSTAGEFGFDAQGDCIGPVKACDVTIEKFCQVEGQLPDPNGPSSACLLEAAPAGTPCQEKPASIKFKYVGTPGLDEPVQIKVYKEGDPGTEYADEMALIGDIFEATAANAGETKFASKSTVDVLALPGMGLLETINIHTSCSQPLEIGQVFGPVQIVGLDDLTFGQVVNYTYKITNPSATDGLKNIGVTDVANGVTPVAVTCTFDTLPPLGMDTCTSSEFITENTMNMATVLAQADNENMTICSAGHDNADVEVVPSNVTKKKKQKKKTKMKIKAHKAKKLKKQKK